MVINNKDTLFQNHSILKHNQNNVQFNLSVPWFNNPQHIYFKYRLINGPNKAWAITNQGERNIRYAALMPGKYTFEAIAMAASGEIAINTMRYSFSIDKPWWQQWWFILLTSLTGSALIFLLVRAYFLLRLRKERLHYEQRLAIEVERQRIGSEIHDDVSAGLSALRLQTSLIEEKVSNDSFKEDISKIHHRITQLSAQLREVIWALNPDHDALENLIYYLQQQTVSFFDQTGIQVKIRLPEEILEKKISGEKRRNVYLAMKESFQNIIKHAQATAVSVELSLTSKTLQIIVSDNGIGITKPASVESSGIQNIKKRMKACGGTVNIISEKGTTVVFNIPI